MKKFFKKIYRSLLSYITLTCKKVQEYYYLLVFKYKQPIFIVGCGHSGTSIMLSLLGYHPALYAVDYETRLFYENPLRLNKIYSLVKLAKGKRLLEKTPKHIYYIDKILSIFPRAKIIVMIRDGRDVACSIAERIGNFEEGLKRWIDDNEAWLPYQNHKAVYPLKLEDFLADKEKEIIRLFNFLMLPEYKSIFDYHLSKRSFFKNQPLSNMKEVLHVQRRNWQINQPLFENTHRWKNEMNLSEIELFKEKANKLLLYFNYEANDNWE